MSDGGISAGRVIPALPEDPDSVAAAEEVALRILNGAAQSARGLQHRLQRRGFSEEAAARATTAMIAHGYVDDAALASSLAGRGQRSGHGHIQIAARLRARGVADEAIAGALADVYPGAERDAALALGRRLFERAHSRHPAMDRRQRVFGQLQRRGFDTETAHWVLRQLEPRD